MTDGNSYITFITIITIYMITISSLIIVGVMIYNELSKRRKLHELAIYGDLLRNSSDIYEILDKFIDERLSEYRIFNINLFSATLSDAMQTKITKEVTIDVVENISPILYNQLTLVINPDRERILRLINTRVMMAVVSLNISDGGQELLNNI